MAVSEETPREVDKLLSSGEEVHEPSLATKVSVVLWTGWGLVFVGLIILGVAVGLSTFWTAPAANCPQFGGSPPNSCPAGELTTNNFAVVLVLMLWSGVLVALGGILACTAWLHKPTRA